MKCTCICCRREMDSIIETGLQPVDGLCFSSPGHYGTSVFDPMDGSRLEIAVCDDCLVKAGKRGYVVRERLGAERAETWAPPKLTVKGE